MSEIIQYIPYLIIPVLLAYPLGKYISQLIDDDSKLMLKFRPVERSIWRFLRLDVSEMNWKKYVAAVFVFSGAGFILLMLILMFQNVLPLNPQHLPGMPFALAFNTAASFLTNTNWQSYSGEVTLSPFAQIVGLTVQNFLAAAVGIAVLFALMRGLKKASSQTIGNFWKDIIRIMVYLLVPLSLVTSLALVACGVPQSLSGSKEVKLVQPVAVDKNRQAILNAKIDVKKQEVTVDGKKVKDAQILTKQHIPLYAQASQVAIKQLGTNGGGVLGTNAAHPFENPNIISNLIEVTAMILIPISLCFAFGNYLGKKKEGYVLFLTMALLFIVGLAISAWAESKGHVVSGIGNLNLEGKETRFGIASSVIFAVVTTATSCGAVNAAMDSMSALAAMIPMMFIQLGEVVFGGVGSGLYGMLGFVLLTVFIASLMVGRTPEYLGKKIGPKEMKMAILACLATPLAILIGSGLVAVLPNVTASLTNNGAHGFSEFLYAFSSAGGNNGSAFAGFMPSATLNVILGLVMLLARYLSIFGILAIAGSMCKQKITPASSGTLTTTNTTFVILLIIVIFIIGVLSFFPALALGPIADFLS